MNNPSTTTFAGFGLPELLVKNLAKAGMTTPKPIQEQAIPLLLEGKDLLGIAQTGSGKTLAFSLPLLAGIISQGSRRKPRTARALVLAPTRELAQQIADTIVEMSKDMHLSVALVLGGVSRFKQVKRVAPGVDVLIATPGRLMDLVREKEIDLSETRYLVLDEADRMLDMGFINDVRRIASLVHKERQTTLFSATMPKEISHLAESLLNNPVVVETAPQGTTAADIREQVYAVHRRAKKEALAGLLADPDFTSVIVFTRTKHGADTVKRILDSYGFSSAVIHGNKTQNARQKALQGFRNGSIRVLVATDIAARGIDVPGISHVINYDLPEEAESYVHRIGRTGRNGASGDAITFFDAETESSRLKAVERVTRRKFVIVPFPEALKAGKPPANKVVEAENADARDDRKPRKSTKARKPRGFAGKRVSGEKKGNSETRSEWSEEAPRKDTGRKFGQGRKAQTRGTDDSAETKAPAGQPSSNRQRRMRPSKPRRGGAVKSRAA